MTKLTKVCNMCNKDLPLDSFHRGKSPDGRQYSCKDCKREYQRKSSTRKEVSSRYYHKNKHKHLALVRSRQAGLSKATPKWLSKQLKEEISNFYWLARDLSTVTGEPYEVDHIHPLKGENFCGLHVPWNLQVLPRDINRSKHNKLLEAATKEDTEEDPEEDEVDG